MFHLYFAWWQKVNRGNSRRVDNQARLAGRWRRARLSLEQLEDRVMPAQYIWTGEGADQNWTTGANWQGEVAPTGAGTDDLIFPAAPGGSLVSNNNFGAGTAFDSLVFQGGGYLVTGNALTLNPTNNGGIGLIDTGNNVIQLAATGIALGSSQSFVCTAGTLVLAPAAGATSTVAAGVSALTVTGVGNLAITGVVSGTSAPTAKALIKGSAAADSGTLTLTAANTYTGITAVNDGIVTLANPAALGTTNNATIAAGADLQLLGGFGASLTISSLAIGGTLENVSGNDTISGAIDLTTPASTGNANVAVDQGTLTLSGPIMDHGANLGLTTSGPGTLVLAGNGSAYAGKVNVSAGILSVTAAGALGTGSVSLASGASLQLNTTIPVTFTNPLTVAGSGVNNAGALENNDSSDTWAGGINLDGGSAIGASLLGATLTLSGGVSGSAASALTVTGAGTVALSAANSYTGNTIVNGSLTLNNAGTVVSPLVTVNASGSLTLDNTAKNVTNRLNGAALNLDGGAFSLLGNISGATRESVGAVTLNPGSSTIAVINGSGQTAALTLASLTRSAAATVNILGLTLGSSSLNITNVASVPLVNGILPFAIVNSADFATYSGPSNNVAAYSSYATTLVGAGPTSNVKLTGNDSVQGAAQTINSLIINGTLTIGGTGTLTIGGGALLTTNGNTSTISAPLAFSTEDILTTEGTATTSIGSTISGSGALTVAGSGTMALGAGSDSFTGGTNLTQGTLSLGSSANLGTGTVALLGGTFSPTVPLPFANPVALDGAVTFAGAATSFLGHTTLTGNSVITANQAVSFQGVVSGNGSLTVAAGVSAVTLNNANTYTGGTVLAIGGTLNVGDTGALGNSTLSLAGGAIGSNVSVNLPNPVALANAAVSITGTNNLTFSGPVTLTGLAVVTITNTGLTSFTGTIAGSGAMTIAGAGVVSLAPVSGANTYTGGTTLSGSTVLLGDNSVFGTGTLILAGGTLFAPSAIDMANSVVVSASSTFSGSLSNAASLTLSGPVVLIANSTLTVLNNTTIAGVIGESGGSFALTVAGSGTLMLDNADYYTGGTTLNASGGAANTLGTLAVGTGNSVGSGKLTLTTGVFLANNPVTMANAVALNAAAPVAFADNSITFNGAVMLSSTPLLLVNNTTTFAGGVTGNVPLTLSGTPVEAGANAVLPTGNLILNSMDTSASTLTIDGGTFTLCGNVAAELPAITSIIVNSSGTFTESTTTAYFTNLVNSAASMTLSGGTFNFLGAGGVPAAQTLGNLTLNAGSSTIVNVAGPGGLANLTFGALNNSFPGSALNLQAGQTGDLQQLSAAGANQISFTSLSSSTIGSIVPRLTVTDASAVTVDGNFGPPTNLKLATISGVTAPIYIVPLTTYTSLNPDGGNAGNNVLVSSSVAYDSGVGSDSVNSILFVGDSLAINGGSVTGNSTLSVTSGMIATAGGATDNGDTITVGLLNLGAEGILVANDGNGDGSATLVVNSPIGGTGDSFGLTVAGPGTVNLAVANNLTAGYTGPTTLAGGTLILGTPGIAGSANVLGNSTTALQLIGGALQASTTVVFNNPVTLSNSNITIGGSNNITFEPNTNVGTGFALGGAGDVLNITNSASTVIDSTTAITGLIGGAGILTKQGAGMLILAGSTANTYTGQTLILGGVINIQGATSLGATAVPAIVATGGTLQIQSSSAATNDAEVIVLAGGTEENTFGANTLSGNTMLIAPSTIQVDAGSLAVSGILSGPGDLTKVGDGTLTLSGVNTFTGQVNIDSGIVNLTTSGSALGAITSNAIVNSGATLQIITTNGLTFLKPLTLNGAGYLATNLGGALQLAVNAATWAGNITLDPGTSIGADSSGDTLTLSGIVGGTGDLTKVGLGSLSLQANNIYTGNTYVDQGTLTLNNSGTALNATNFIVNPGATLILDNSSGNAVNLANRVSTSATVTMNGGILELLGGNGAGLVGLASSEQVGTILLNSGDSTIETLSGNLSGALVPPSLILNGLNLQRRTGATGSFLGFISGTTTPNLYTASNQITFQTAPTLSNGILPYATANNGPTSGGDFATYMANGIGAFTSYATSLTAGPNAVVELTTSTILSGSDTVGALLLTGGVTLSEDGFTLTLGSASIGVLGGVLSTNGSNLIIGGVLNAGTTEGIVQDGNATTTLNSTIAGSAGAGLTISGIGQVNLPNADTYTGATYLDGCTLQVGSNKALGSGALIFSAGTLQANAAVTLGNALQFNDSSVTIGGQNDITFAGGGTLAGANSSSGTFFSTLTFASSALTMFTTGVLSGPGALLLAGTGVFLISGANTYAGGTYLTGGSLIVGNNNALGSGSITLTAGSLLADAAGRDLANNLVLNSSASTVTLGGSSANGGSAANSTLTFTGTVTVAVSTSLSVLTTVTVDGNLIGPGLLTIGGLNALAGPGNVVLNGNDSSFSGGITLDDGSLGALGLLTVGSTNPNPDFALGTGPLTLTNGQLVNNSGSALIMGMPIGLGAAVSNYVKFSGANSITFHNALPTANTIVNTAAIIVNTSTTFDAVFTGSGGVTMLSDGTGNGNSTLSFTQAQDFAPSSASSFVTVASGTLRLAGLGSLAALAYYIDVGGSLVLDATQNQASFNPSRITTSGTEFYLNGGTLISLGSNAAGAVTNPINPTSTALQSAYNTIINVTGTGPGAESILNLGDLAALDAPVNFEAGLTGNLQTFNTTTNQLTYDTAPTLIGGIIPGATVTDASAVTVGSSTVTTNVKLATTSGTNILPLAAYSSLSATGGDTGKNVLVSASVTYSSSVGSDSVNSLLIVGDGLTIGSSTTSTSLNVTSGTIVSTRGGATTNIGNAISVNALTPSATNEDYVLTNDGELTINSLITGSGLFLNLGGAGILSLPNPNVTPSGAPSFSNAVFVDGGSTPNSGTLLLGVNNAIPSDSSTLALLNGTIGAGVFSRTSGVEDSSGPVTISNPIRLGDGSNTNSVIEFGAGGSIVGAVGNGNSLIFTGTMALTGTSDLVTSNIGDAATPGLPPGVFFTGIVSGTAANGSTSLIKQGMGTLILTAANTYVGPTLINQGVVNVQNGLALGPAADGQVIVASGATVQLENASVGTKPLILTGGGVTNGAGALENVAGAADAWNGPIALLGSTTIATNVGQLTLSAIISGAADLTSAGGGTLVLAGANTYTGQTNINNGIVQITTATALGSIAGGATVATGATLELGAIAANTITGEQLTLNGNGFGLYDSGLLTPSGALQDLDTAPITWTGNIVLNTSSTLDTPNATLTVTGALTDNSGSGGSPAALTKVGIGALALAAANTYTGATSISVGMLDLNSDGSLLNTSNIIVNEDSNGTGTTLQLDNSASTGTGTLTVNFPNRVAATSPIMLNGGLLNYLGNNNGGVLASEAFGPIALADGSSTIDSTAGSGAGDSVQLTIKNLSRSTGATVVFAGGNQALGSPANQIEFLTPPALTNGILPYATVQSPGGNLDLASYGATQTIAFGAVTGGIFELSFNGVNTAPIAWNSNPVTLATNIQNALNVPSIGNENIAVSGSGPFTVNFLNVLANSAPAQLAAYSNSLTGTLPTISFATTTNAASITAFANYKTTLAAAGPTDNVKITDSEALTGNLNVNALLVTGANTVTLNNYTLTLGGGALGATGGAVTFAGGTLNFGSLEGILNANVNTTLDSAVAGTSGFTISDTGGTTVALNVTGTYTGSTYSTIFNGPGVLTVGTGPVNVSSALGNGRLLLTGGTFGAAATGGQFALDNPITLNDNGVVALGTGQNMTLTGPIALGAGSAALVTSVSAANTIILAGTITGSDALDLIGGSGALVIAGANTYTGGTNLGGGTLIVNRSSTAGASPLGTGVLDLTGGTIQSSDLALQQVSIGSATIGNPVVFTNANVNIGGAATASAMLLDTTLFFTGNDTVTGTNLLTINDPGVPTATGRVTPGVFFNGIISGPGALTFKTGATAAAGTGLVQLGGANTFTGGVAISPTVAGQIITVVIANNSALGTGLLTLSSGNATADAILQDDGTAARTIGNPVSLAPSMASNPDVINATNPSFTFTLTGPITGAGLLQKGLASLAGAVPSNSAGTLMLTSTETYTGATIVDQGLLDLTGGSGGIVGSISIALNQGAILELDNTGANNGNRVADAATISLAGGNFVFLGSASLASSETLSALTVNAGNSIVGITAGVGGTAALLFGSTTTSFTRAAGGLVTFQTVNPLVGGTPTQMLTGTLGSSSIALDSVSFAFAPTMSDGIIPGAVVYDDTSVTGNSSGFNLADFTKSCLTAYTAYTTFGPSGDDNNNVLVTGSDSYGSSIGSDSPNALLFVGGATLSGSTTVTVNSGMIVAASGSDTLSVTLASATERETVTSGNSTLTITGVVAGTGALMIGGGGTLNLATTNIYSGNTYLDSGTLQMGNAALGSSSVTIAGGSIQSTAAAGATESNAIALGTGTGAVTFSGNDSLTLSGAITGTGSLTVNASSSSVTLTYSGSNGNTYTGITTVNEGTLSLGKTAGSGVQAYSGQLVINTNGAVIQSTSVAPQFGSGNAVVNGNATLTLTAATASTFGNLILNNSSITVASPFGITLNANSVVVTLPNTTSNISGIPLILGAGVTHTFVTSVGSSLTVGALLESTATPNVGNNLVKIGAGTLFFSGSAANTYSTGPTITGITTVNEGVLQLAKTAGAAAITGPLVIGNFSGSAAVEMTTNSNQLTNTAVNVFVNGNGTFDVTDGGTVTVGATIGSLDMRGGLVTIGSDTLTLSGNVDGLAGNGGSSTISSSATGQLALGANCNFTVVDSSTTTLGLTVSAVITGPGFGLTKLGAGTLTLAPPVSDSFGSTTVDEGTLLLGASTFANAIAIPGSLQIGDFIGGDGQDVVGFVGGSYSGQIASTAAVSMDDSGALDLNNVGTSANPVAVGSLTMIGGSVNIGTGYMTLNGNLLSKFNSANVNDPYSPTGVNFADITGSGAISLAGDTTIDVQPGLGSLVDPVTGIADLADLVIQPALVGGPAVSLTKQDTGILRLTGISPFAGPTTVNGGIMLVDGYLANSSVTVNSLAILGGTGVTGAEAVNGGTVNPGDPIAGTSTLTLNGPANFTNGGTLTVEVTGSSTTGFRADLLNLGSSNLILGGTSTLTVDLNGLTAYPSSTITIIQDGGTLGTFTNVNVIGNPNNIPVTPVYHGNSVTLTIAPTSFQVISFVPTATGFTATFNRAFLNTSTNPIHLYSALASNANYGPPDLTVVGPSGTVDGSLIVNATNTGFTFIKTDVATGGGTSGLLTPGTYTVTFVSSGQGFQDTNNNLLNDGTNYSVMFTVTSPPPATVTVSIPDFARGPDSADSINLINNTSNGIPVSLSNGNGVTSGSVTVTYNPSQLTVSGAFPNRALSGASFTLDPSSSAGNAILDFSSPAPLSSSAVTLGGLIATVPSNAPYKSKQLLQISSVLNGGAIQTINDDAVQVVIFLGNVSGTGFYSSLDSGLMLNVSSGADAGFAAFPVIDPVILGDLNGAGQVNTTDALQLNLRIATGFNQLIPVYPGPPSNNPSGPDPMLSLPMALMANTGGTVLAPVNIDTAMPVGSMGMTAAQLALRYDPTEFSVTPQDIQLGSIPDSGSGWTLRAVVDPSTGTIGISLSSETPISSTESGSLVVIALHEKASATTGATAIELVASVLANGQPYSTSVNDRQGPFTLTPAPTNIGTAPGLDSMILLPNVETAALTVGNHDNTPTPVVAELMSLAATPPATGSAMRLDSTNDNAVLGPETGELISVALAVSDVMPLAAFTQIPIGLIETGWEQNAALLQPLLALETVAANYAFTVIGGPVPPALGNFTRRVADQVFLAMSDGIQNGKVLPIASNLLPKSAITIPVIQGDLEALLGNRGTDEIDATNLGFLDAYFAQVAEARSQDGE